MMVSQLPALTARCEDLVRGDLVIMPWTAGVDEGGHLTRTINKAASVLLFTHRERLASTSTSTSTIWTRFWFLHADTGVVCYRYDEHDPQFYIIARLQPSLCDGEEQR